SPGGRESANLLVTPRAVERVLAHWQELDVRVPQVADVVAEPLAKLSVREEPVPLLGDPPPRAEMDLVDRHGSVEGVPPAALGGPALIVPGVPVQRGNDRRRTRFLDLELEGERIRLEREQGPVLPQDLELVSAPLAEPRDEQLPDAGAGVTSHRVSSAIPLVEVTHHTHAASVGRPHREHD